MNHNNIPAACFTHPEIAMVGLNEEQAKKKAQEEGFTLGKSQGSFKANSKVILCLGDISDEANNKRKTQCQGAGLIGSMICVMQPSLVQACRGCFVARVVILSWQGISRPAESSRLFQASL